MQENGSKVPTGKFLLIHSTTDKTGAKVEQNFNQLPAEVNPQGRELAVSRRAGGYQQLQSYKRQPDIISRSIRPTDFVFALRRRCHVTDIGIFLQNPPKKKKPSFFITEA